MWCSRRLSFRSLEHLMPRIRRRGRHFIPSFFGLFTNNLHPVGICPSDGSILNPTNWRTGVSELWTGGKCSLFTVLRQAVRRQCRAMQFKAVWRLYWCGFAVVLCYVHDCLFHRADIGVQTEAPSFHFPWNDRVHTIRTSRSVPNLFCHRRHCG